MKSYTNEELAEAIRTLDEIEKSQSGMDLSPGVNGGGSENIQNLKAEYVDTVKKAKEIQSKIEELEGEKFGGKEKIEKSDEGEVPEKEVEKEEEGEKTDKKKEGEPDLDKEEIMKGIKTSILSEVGEEINSMKSTIETLQTQLREYDSQPIRKSFTGGQLPLIERFEKSKGEGKQPLHSVLQKSQISNHIYNLYVECTDEIEKGVISDAILQYESAGYLSPDIQAKLSQKYNVEIL